MNPREQRRYLHQVRRRLACPHKNKAGLVQHFKSQLLEYLEQNPEVSQEDVYALFGDPKTVAGRYLAQVEPEILKKHKRHKRIVQFVFVLLVLASFIILYEKITSERPGVVIDSPVVEITDTN